MLHWEVCLWGQADVQYTDAKLFREEGSHGHACNSAVCWSDVMCAQIPVPVAVHDEQAAQFLVNPVRSRTLCFHQQRGVPSCGQGSHALQTLSDKHIAPPVGLRYMHQHSLQDPCMSTSLGYMPDRFEYVGLCRMSSW